MLLKKFPFFYGWVVVAVAFGTLAIGVNTRTSFSLLFPPILAEFGWNRGSTAAAFSWGFLAAVVYAPIVGMLMDRFGPRFVMPLGAVMVSAGMVLVTFISQPWHLYVAFGALVGGASTAISYLGHALFLPHWFVRRRSLALGIAFSGVGVGSIILFPWVQRMIDQVGWREACWVVAGMVVVIVFPLNAVLQRHRPEDLSLAPDGDTVSHRTAGGQAHADNVVDHAWAATDWTLARAIRTARFWWLGLSFFSCLYAWYAIQVHQTKYLRDIGFLPETAAFALGLVGLTACAGQIGLGFLSDRIGRERVWTIGMLGFVLCYAFLLMMPLYPTPVLLYVMVVVQGMLGYGTASVYAAIPSEVFQGKQYGRIYGTLTISGSLGGGTGPWVTGLLFDKTGSYAAAFWCAMVLAGISIGSMWMASPRKVRVVAGQIGLLATQQPPAQPAQEDA